MAAEPAVVSHPLQTEIIELDDDSVVVVSAPEMCQEPEASDLPEPAVRLDVIGTEAVVTIASSLLIETEVQPDVAVMDRASRFLSQQFRLTPADVGPSIESPRRGEILPGVSPIPAPSEDAPSTEEAVPAVVVVASEGMEVDAKPQAEQDAAAGTDSGPDYGSNEDRAMAYLQTLEDVLAQGRVIGQHALTRRRELQMIRAFTQTYCHEHSRSCFEDEGGLR
jgi:hypothetical protein